MFLVFEGGINICICFGAVISILAVGLKETKCSDRTAGCVKER